jgi:hypothetical protein
MMNPCLKCDKKCDTKGGFSILCMDKIRYEDSLIGIWVKEVKG